MHIQRLNGYFLRMIPKDDMESYMQYCYYFSFRSIFFHWKDANDEGSKFVR